MIDTNTSYNILPGRLSINWLMAIVSTPHLAMKFSSASGDILTLHVDQKVAREARYMIWLANIVMVTKSNDKWRMYVDYMNLNKACLKDSYPLPNIDRLVDGAAGHKILGFLNAYSRYNQINMHPQDKEKTTFVTIDANYYYRVIPFGLKNAGATYQRLMDKIFKALIGRCIEVYVDDIVVKSDSFEQHVKDLEEVFEALRRTDMRLNPEKCTFGVEGGKFLGFMLTTGGSRLTRTSVGRSPRCEVPRT